MAQGTVVLTLSGRNYITCRSILAAAASELSSVSWEQVKSKDMLTLMVDAMLL